MTTYSAGDCVAIGADVLEGSEVIGADVDAVANADGKGTTTEVAVLLDSLSPSDGVTSSLFGKGCSKALPWGAPPTAAVLFTIPWYAKPWYPVLGPGWLCPGPCVTLGYIPGGAANPVLGPGWFCPKPCETPGYIPGGAANPWLGPWALKPVSGGSLGSNSLRRKTQI